MKISSGIGREAVNGGGGIGGGGRMYHTDNIFVKLHSSWEVVQVMISRMQAYLGSLVKGELI